MGFGCFESFFACCLLCRCLDQLLDITFTLHFLHHIGILDFPDLMVWNGSFSRCFWVFKCRAQFLYVTVVLHFSQVLSAFIFIIYIKNLYFKIFNSSKYMCKSRFNF